MEEEKYWRKVIGDEIKAEHDKVKKYYMRKDGGMTTEDHVRLNIFGLCESIARTKSSESKPLPERPQPKAPKKKPLGNSKQNDLGEML